MTSIQILFHQENGKHMNKERINNLREKLEREIDDETLCHNYGIILGFNMSENDNSIEYLISSNIQEEQLLNMLISLVDSTEDNARREEIAFYVIKKLIKKEDYWLKTELVKHFLKQDKEEVFGDSVDPETFNLVREVKF